MTTAKIDTILQTVYQRVQKLIPSERFYTVLYDASKDKLSFPLIKERDQFLSKQQTQTVWAERPYFPEKMLPDQIIAHGATSLYREDIFDRLEQEKISYWPGESLPQAWLGVPLITSGQAIGALVLENWQKSEIFTENDVQILTTIARQTSNAIENLHLQQQLERKIENLRILNRVGQQLSRGIGKKEHEILDLICKSASELQIDTRNMYIALEEDLFKTEITNETPSMLRFAVLLNDGKPRDEVRNHPANEGLSGYVIRTKSSFNPPNTQKAYEEHVPDRTKKIYRSWLGVPMISEDRVFGVIVVRNDEREHAYTHDDQEMLELLAAQAAVALQNLWLYQSQQRAQEKKAAAESMSIMGLVAAEFAHKMNNLAGTIPVRISFAKSQIDQNDPKNKKIIEQLGKIEDEADGILKAAQKIRESNIQVAKEEIDINQLIKTEIANVQKSQINKQNNVKVITELSEDLPYLIAEANPFRDTIASMIKNSFEAIDNLGTITITSQRSKFNGRNTIEIKIADTGKGIPTSDLPKIFDLFYSTKGSKGLGFGLWRDRVFIKQLGGEIDVDSKENNGSTFTIRIPIK